MAKMHEHPGLSPLAYFLHEAIDRSEKTQRQLATEIGFDCANMISMIKHDDARLPFDKVIATAIALKVDVAHLMRLVLERDWPRRLSLLEDIFGLVISTNEKRLILVVRRESGNADPDFSEAEVQALVKKRAT